MNKTRVTASPQHIKSYVLRGGRAGNLQRRALNELADEYCINFRNEQMDLSSFFQAEPNRKKSGIIVEIGFGMGLATAKIAQNNPDIFYVGIEVFEAGIGKLLSEIKKRNLDNVRIIAHDAAEVVQNMILDGSLAGAHVFFPDPWPKTRHHKRRLIQEQFLHTLCKKLEPSGYFYAVTDWQEYAEEILRACSREKLLTNPFAGSGLDGFAPSIPWRPTTRFEEKGKSRNHTIREIFFRKLNSYK